MTPYLLKDNSDPNGVDRSVFDQMVDGLKKDRPGFLAGFAKLFYRRGHVEFLDQQRLPAMVAEHGNAGLAESHDRLRACVLGDGFTRRSAEVAGADANNSW